MAPVLLTAKPGLTFGGIDPLAFAYLGAVLLIAVAALSHQGGRPFSAALTYLPLGVLGALAVQGFGGPRLDPIANEAVIEHVAEVALAVALFTSGLRVERVLERARHREVALLLLVGMPLAIGAVALYGALAMGLSAGAAVLLGAALAPTDPVLAGDIGVGPPGDEERRGGPRLVVTAEAGFNDGLASPFVLLGVLIARHPDPGDYIGSWIGADLLYATVVGLGLGALLGYGFARAYLALRERGFVASRFDGWAAVAFAAALYGIAELAGGYGFLAAFAGGLAFRRHEQGHEYHEHVHAGSGTAERFAELAVILLLGSALTTEGLGEPGVAGWLLVPALFFVIRPATAFLALAGCGLRRRGRAFVAWFGVRGVAALYYASFLVATGALGPEEERVVVWTTIAVVVASVVIHGATASPVTQRLLAGGDAAEPSPRSTAGSG